MTMKYITYLLIALIIPVGASALVDAQLQRYDPTPAQPGDLLTVQLSITNNADTRAQNVELELLASNTVSPEGKNTLTAGTIGAYSSFQGSLQVRVAADAPPGEAVLRIRVREQGSDWQERTGTIQVQPSQAGILISDVQLSPEAVNPGRTATLTLEVQNNANSLLREVSTQLQLAETPFVPAQTATRKRVGDLATGSQATVTYQLTAQPEAHAGIYRIPVTLSFLDRNGNSVEQLDMIGVTVTTPQQTLANVDNVQRTDEGAEVSVRIVNKGLSEIKFLETHVQEGEGYTIRAQERSAYLGNVDSDDWQTMRFNIQSSAEQVQIPLTYTYQDTFNDPHEQEQLLTITLPPAQGGGLGAVGIIALLLIAGGIYWVYKKRKSKA